MLSPPADDTVDEEMCSAGGCASEMTGCDAFLSSCWAVFDGAAAVEGRFRKNDSCEEPR